MQYAPKHYQRFFESITRTPTCWLWEKYRHPNGYGQASCMGKQQAHRLAYRLFRGPIPPGLCVLHRCDNPPCVNPFHLFLGTNQDNAADKMEKGRYRGVRGERVGNSKLTEEQILIIRREYAAGVTQTTLASKYNVQRPNISLIVNNRTWAWLK